MKRCSRLLGGWSLSSKAPRTAPGPQEQKEALRKSHSPCADRVPQKKPKTGFEQHDQEFHATRYEYVAHLSKVPRVTVISEENERELERLALPDTPLPGLPASLPGGHCDKGSNLSTDLRIIHALRWVLAKVARERGLIWLSSSAAYDLLPRDLVQEAVPLGYTAFFQYLLKGNKLMESSSIERTQLNRNDYPDAKRLVMRNSMKIECMNYVLDRMADCRARGNFTCPPTKGELVYRDAFRCLVDDGRWMTPEIGQDDQRLLPAVIRGYTRTDGVSKALLAQKKVHWFASKLPPKNVISLPFLAADVLVTRGLYNRSEIVRQTRELVAILEEELKDEETQRKLISVRWREIYKAEGTRI